MAISILFLHVVNEDDFELLKPTRATARSTGLDLKAAANIFLEPGQRAAVPTGIEIDFSKAFDEDVQIRPRSGLALHTGVTVLNSPGTVDMDYEGEVKVILINLSTGGVAISKGDRIAQLVVRSPEVLVRSGKPIRPKPKGPTRGTGGFGSTGR